jgi:hypothetical protein
MKQSELASKSIEQLVDVFVSMALAQDEAEIALALGVLQMLLDCCCR